MLGCGGIRIGAYDYISHYCVRGACHIICFGNRFGLGTINTQTKKKPRSSSWFFLCLCPGQDLNLHTFRLIHLKDKCLPISTPGHEATILKLTQVRKNRVRRGSILLMRLLLLFLELHRALLLLMLFRGGFVSSFCGFPLLPCLGYSRACFVESLSSL